MNHSLRSGSWRALNPLPVIFITGPTGAGKTGISVKLAKKINGEIICCDSMQIYKGMDILTAQPSKKETAAIKHHLFSIKKPTENFSVAQYRKLALKKITEIHNRGKTPVFVGGTGLYAQALIDGLFHSPKEDVKLRKKLYAYTEKYGSNKLYAKLKKIDPVTAEKIHPNDIRRIVRALEIYKSTGKRMSVLKKTTRGGIWGLYDVKIFCFYYKDRSVLYGRINKRVDVMFNSGLINEVKRLIRMRLSKTAMQALGIKQLQGYLNGEYDLESAKDLLKKETRRYAKRQISWFRRDKRVKWAALDTTGVVYCLPL